MFLSIGMLKLNYFLADIFILSAEKQPIKLSWRKIEWLHSEIHTIHGGEAVYLMFHKLKSYLYDQKYSYSDRKNIGFL